ncbi:MAG: flagellar filament capping protein FliD [Erythrobacter sp.]
MDNPGSSIISTLGAGSGVDFIKLADDLSEATFAARRQALEQRNETLDARISAASLLRNSLTELSSALGDRVRNGDLAPRATLANPSVARVSTTPGITPRGTYTLEVDQLAKGQTLVSRNYAGADALVGEGSVEIRFGTVEGGAFTADGARDALEVTLDATDTLATLAGKIRAASDGAIDAYVATGTDGARLVLKGDDGAASGFVVEGRSTATSPSDTPGDPTYLSWNPGADTGELRQQAQDALFELDTVAMSSPSNTVTGLPEGMTLDLAGTNPDAPTTIAFQNDPKAISAVMQDFVAALNDLAGLLTEQAAAQGGTLGNDSAARDLRRDLQRLTTDTVMPTAGEGKPSTLADLGLSLTREGTFRLDTDRLGETLTRSPDAAAAMFTTGPFGVFATIDNLARDNTLRSDPGSLGGSINRYEAQVERNDDRLGRIADQQENLRSRLTKELIAAERRVSASQSTLTFLQQQISAWNAGAQG